MTKQDRLARLLIGRTVEGVSAPSRVPGQDLVTELCLVLDTGEHVTVSATHCIETDIQLTFSVGEIHEEDL